MSNPQRQSTPPPPPPPPTPQSTAPPPPPPPPSKRCKAAVNSEKEANWLAFQRKKQMSCQFEVRVNQPPVIIHPTYVSKKSKRKGAGLGCCERGWVKNHKRFINYFFKLTANLSLSLNL